MLPESKKKGKSWGKFAFTLLNKVFFYRTHFHETQKHSRILPRQFVCLIAPHSLRSVEITDRSLCLDAGLNDGSHCASFHKTLDFTRYWLHIVALPDITKIRHMFLSRRYQVTQGQTDGPTAWRLSSQQDFFSFTSWLRPDNCQPVNNCFFYSCRPFCSVWNQFIFISVQFSSAAIRL